MTRTAFLLTSALIFLAAQWARAGEIAVILSADVQPYHEALEGFKDVVDHSVVADYDMRGDFSRGRMILDEIQSEVKPDLILAMGIWALQLVIEKESDLPVVFAMVLNPPAVLGGHVKNVTGASMNVPVDRSISILDELGQRIRRVGVVFNPANTGYLVEMAKTDARQRGLDLMVRAIASPKEAIKAVDSLKEEGIDALWILPDETVLDPKVIEYALLMSYRNNIPLLGLSERQAEMGALFSIAFSSSKDIGRQAGQLANEILGGERADQLPYTTARSVKLIVNLKAAEKLGMQIPDRILAMADTVIH